MKKTIIAGLALSALFGTLGEVHALNYPWCIRGDTRGASDCHFSTKDQCAADGRGRGFGSQCYQNPPYDPSKGPLGEPITDKRPRRQ
jgi:Protein of unknown function (DUF3551)